MKTKIAYCLAPLLLTLMAMLEARADADAMQWNERALVEMGDLRTPLGDGALARGAAASRRAKAIGGTTERECELIDAVAQFYHRADERTHDERLVHYERALSRSRQAHPADEWIVREHERAGRAALARARERAAAAYARRLAEAP